MKTIKTLSEFKREFKNFKALEMIGCSFDNKLIGQVREVVQSNTVGFSLLTATKDRGLRPSYQNWPKASGFKMTGEDTFELEFVEDNSFGQSKNAFHYKIIQS